MIACLAGVAAASVLSPQAPDPGFTVVGVAVTPHVRAPGMRFRRDPGPADGALVRLIVTPSAGAGARSRKAFRFGGKRAKDLVDDGSWAWCDMPGSETGAGDTIKPGELTVLTFNTRAPAAGIGSKIEVSIDGRSGSRPVSLDPPTSWLSAVTFLGSQVGARVGRVVVHVANAAESPLQMLGLRFWQPVDRSRCWALSPGTAKPVALKSPTNGVIPGNDVGIVTARVPLELTYAVVGLDVRRGTGPVETLWAHLRVKREAFDISGGWVDGGRTIDGRTALAHPEFVKTLAALHVNTAHYTEVPGYSDHVGPESLYSRFPLKRFHQLQPIERYDADDMVDRVHAVEFIGEPQYGGGRPVPPQEVWQKLHPYYRTRLATSVTLSEEGLWRFYAGLSDYPHYDAYRVNAPAADSWRMYDRWDGARISWGAPLETIGEMSRSLRELSRPTPTAYWSQGPGDWESYGGRKRTAPTGDEIRMQAYHALASRITSLYWFNLSLKNILKFPDTLGEIQRVGREILMLQDYYLAGGAYRYRRLEANGRPSWDLSSIVTPDVALLFALDLDYRPDPEQKEFFFGAPRSTVFDFELPAFLRDPVDVFRVDADGVHSVSSKATPTGVRITDNVSKVAVYVAARSLVPRSTLKDRQTALVAHERAIAFDPIGNPADLDALRKVLADK